MECDPLTPEQMKALAKHRSFFVPYVALNTVLGVVILVAVIYGLLRHFQFI